MIKMFHIDTSFAGAATESWRNAPNATTARMYVSEDIVARERRVLMGGELKQSRRPHEKVNLYGYNGEDE